MIRGAVAVALALLAYVSVTRSLATVIRSKDATRAVRLAPGDGRVAAAAAQSLIDADVTRPKLARAARLARRALDGDPTVSDAAAILGFDAQARGDAKGAGRWFAYAERLSRRELQTQIWLVEDLVSRGDVAGALHHYDIALRTSRKAPDLLFPILGLAIAQPEVRAALARTLAAKPPWSALFVQYVAAAGPDPLATAQLLEQLRRSHVPVTAEARANTTNALVARGLMGQAWRFYAAGHPGAARDRSRDPGFTAAASDPSAFDWAPINNGGVAVTIQQGSRPGDGLLDFSVPPTLGGPLVQQAQLLPPGQYRLTGRSAGIEQDPEARPYWVLTCRDGRELGRVALPDSRDQGGMFDGRFTVPAGCAMQMLSLIARSSDAAAGMSGQISRAALVPVH